MTAPARVLDYVFLVAGLWLAWVLVFQWAGPEALSPRAPRCSAWESISPARSSGHTPRRPALPSPMPALSRSSAGSCWDWPRRQPLGRRGRRADPLIALFHSEDHALPRHSTGVRARRFRQGCIRRLARNFSGRALCHRRAQEYEPRNDQDGARAPPRAGRNRAHRAVARGAAGDHHRPSHRLFSDVARHADRRAFRLRSRPRLHADTRHGGAQGARYHGADAAAVRICRERECAVARCRAARAPAVSAAASLNIRSAPVPIATARDGAGMRGPSEVPKPHRLMLPWNGVKFTLPHDAM